MRSLIASLIATALIGGAGWAQSPSRPADLAARIEFGYFAHDAAMIAAARDDIEQSRDPALRYLLGFAALRQAQLGVGLKSATACLAATALVVEHDPEDAEGWILMAACAREAALQEPVKSVLHRRRMQQGLERAALLEPNNPRLALLRAQLSDGAEAAAALHASVQAYRNWPQLFDWPNWGEAEAYLALGEHYLERRNLRQARDALEQALAIAPDYVRARAVYGRLVSHGSPRSGEAPAEKCGANHEKEHRSCG
jgi:tetratricopeptide (TPR) repeat protein